MISTAYAGTRVVELASGLAAGVVGRVFADLGADVVRVELPERALVDRGEIAAQAWTRARKRTVDRPQGRPFSLGEIEPLLAGADLLISDLTVAHWERLLPSPQSIVDAHPGLVLLDMTRYGRTGPYAHYEAADIVSLASGGYLYMCGLNSREPLRIGVDLIDVVTGVNGSGGAMAGLHHARRTGQGQVVEVSAMRTVLGTATSFPISYSMQGSVRRRSMSRAISIGTLVPCADGHVIINTFRTASEMLFVLLNDDRLLDEKFNDYIGRELAQAELNQIMVEAAAGMTMRELFEQGQDLRMQNAMVQSPLQTPECPQHENRQFFQPLTLEDGRTIAAPVTPLVPISERNSSGNAPGTTVALGDAAWIGDAVPRGDAQPTRKALEGLKVLELTFAWAGPFMGRILSDHGAEVVKVESAVYVDTAKGADLADLSFGESGRWTDRSLAYIVANPNKYHVGVELTDPAGKELILDLVRWADVVIENFTPRVLPNLGLGWELFKSVNPSLIMISATGFGHTGPYREYGAWGWGLECMSGVAFQTGYIGDPDPLVFSPTVPDPMSATTGVAVILAALEERRRTGEGQWIDLSQYECATFATLVDIVRAGDAGETRPRVGNRHAWKAPQGVYPSTGNDNWVAVGVETDEQWLALCAALGRDDLAADDALRTHAGRYAAHDRLDEVLGQWTVSRSKHEAMAELQAAGVPAGAVQNSKDLPDDPQLQAMEYFRAAWGQELGLRIWPGPWYAMQTTPGDVERGPSVFAEDTEMVMRELLGYGDDKIAELLASPTFPTVQDGLQKPSAPGLPVETLLERGAILSWDEDYKKIPARVGESNQRWRSANGLAPKRLDGRG
ncbi:MAG: CoA transferase [Acidimicrobiia bacterium]